MKSGTGKSRDVYPFVLGELTLEKYLDVLCIIRLLRNVAHNNGTHTGDTVTKQFRNKPYVFEKIRNPSYMLGCHLSKIAKVKDLFVDIANSDKLRQSTIADPNSLALQQFQQKLFGNERSQDRRTP